MENTYPFDAIIVLGAGIQEKNNGVEPMFDGKMRTIAAAEAFRQRLAPFLVFSGGKTAGEQLPSEARVMSDFLKRKYKNESDSFTEIPTDQIVLEEKSKNTAENLENILKLIKERGWQKVAFLTNDYHLPRVQELAHNYGIDAQELSAEDELEQRDPRFQRVIDKYYESSEIKAAERKEKILKLLLKIDKKGKLPGLITARTRQG